MGDDLGRVVVMLVAANPHHIPEQGAALCSIDPVVENWIVSRHLFPAPE